jgi:type VI secretion system protein ImpG
MQQTLLRYFDDELAYLRKGMQRFAKQYPQVAASLNLNSREMEDPQVTRLLEGFALLSSRTRCHQDELFTELNAALLDALFPHYRAPIPSMSVIALQANPSLQTVSTLARGEQVETLAVAGMPLVFSTCYAVDLTPVTISTAHFAHEVNTFQLTLSSLDPDVKFSDMEIKKLRFYINEQDILGENIYQALLSHCDTVQFDNGPNLPANKIISPVGFNEDEALLPWDNISAPVNRLLSEYFSFKAKFMFFDVSLQSSSLPDSNQLRITFNLKKVMPASFRFVNTSSFSLNCTPVINLFQKELEPVAVDNQHYQYPLLIDKRYPESYEVHTVCKVIDISDSGAPNQLPRLYGQDNALISQRHWHVVRRYNTLNSHEISTCYIRLADTKEKNDNTVLDIQATCFNDNLPAQLDLSSQEANLQLVNASLAVDKIQFLLQPTRVQRQQQNLSEQDQLTLQIANNRLALTDQHQASQYLRTILNACDLSNGQKADMVTNVIPEQVILRSGNSLLSPFIYGTKLHVYLKKSFFEFCSRYLFTQVLQQSFTLDININSRVEWDFIDAE